MQAVKESSVITLLNALRAGASPAEAANTAGMHPLVAEHVAASPLARAFLALPPPEAGLHPTVGCPI